MRGDKPFVFANIKIKQGFKEIMFFIETEGMLKTTSSRSVSN
jgi:hypothetical protein